MPFTIAIQNPPSAINIKHSHDPWSHPVHHRHPKSTTHHQPSTSNTPIQNPPPIIQHRHPLSPSFIHHQPLPKSPPEWYIFWDYIHLLLFFLRDGAIQSLVIFRVHNSVEFPGGWEDEEEDELWEGSGESVSVGAAVGAVGQRLLEQPGSHYLQPFCWRRTKLNPLLTGQMVHRCGLND